MLNRAINLLERSKIEPVVGSTVVRENGVVKADALGAIALGSGKYYVTRNGQLARRPGGRVGKTNRGGTTLFPKAQVLIDVGVDAKHAKRIANNLQDWTDDGESFHRIAQRLRWRK